MKRLQKKICAWALAGATLFTTVAPGVPSMVLADTGTTEEISGTSSSLVGSEPVETDPSVVGRVAFRLPEDGGKVAVNVEDADRQITDTITLDVVKGKTIANVNGSSLQMSPTVEGYTYVVEEPVGSVLEVEFQCDSGYDVASYTVASDEGTVYSSKTPSTLVKNENSNYEDLIYVSEETKIVDLSFNKVEVASEKSTVTETDSDTASREAVVESAEDEVAEPSEVSSEVESESAESDTSSTLGNGTAEWDLSSGRLVILTEEGSEIRESDNVIANYDDLYLVQYDSSEDCESAYNYYKDIVDAVEPDRTVVAASTEDENVSSDIVVTEEENPFATLEAVTEEKETESKDENSGIATFSVREKEAVIALLDTGVEESENVVDRVSVIGDELVGEREHGQDMLGFILAQNPDAQIVSVRVLDDEGRGTVSSIIAGIEYAIEYGVDYINLSLYSKSSLATTVVEKEILKAIDAGITVVGAAGNSSSVAIDYVPGCVEEAYIIGAADELGNILATSNYGDTVDYYVTADSTSEATATFTGYISKYGVDAIEDSGIIFDLSNSDSESGLKHETAPSEIIEKLDSDYITYDEDTIGYGLVANMAIKKTYVREEYATTTLAEFWDRDDFYDGFLINVTTPINLYDVNTDSAYVVGIADKDAPVVSDILFARRNDNAEMLSDEYYDEETGLVYIKKIDLVSVNEETKVLTPNDVQMQMMIASDDSIIGTLVDDGVIKTMDGETFYAASLDADESPAPSSVMGEIIGTLKAGDTITFTVGSAKTSISGQTVNYLWNPGEGAGNDVLFYQALRRGDLPSAQAYWNSSTRHAQYTGDRQWKPTYASYSFDLNPSNVTGISGNSALSTWFTSLVNSGKVLDLDCAHIGESAPSNGYRNVPFTLTCIETGTSPKGEPYAVLAFFANRGSGGGQTLAGIYVISYPGPQVPPEENPRITIRKTDTNGDPVQGIEFVLYGWRNGSYGWEITRAKTDASGMIVWYPYTNWTNNGMFLVKEVPSDGWELSEQTYLNNADKQDFQQYGGRLYWIPRYGGDCVAYRDTEAITILSDQSNFRMVYDHDGYFVSDKWGISGASDVQTCWWCSTKGQIWYPDSELATGWWRSAVEVEDWMTWGSLTYSISGLCAHSYSNNRSTLLGGFNNLSCSGSFYGGNGAPDWSYTTPDGSVTLDLFNVRRGKYSYMFRVWNKTSVARNVACPTWTNDGDQSDIKWIGGKINAGSYVDWIAGEGDFDNLARLVTHVYIDSNTYVGGTSTGTQEYFDSFFVNDKTTTGELSIKKVSDDTSFVSGNTNYTTAGAEYGIYSDSACTKLVDTLVTKADGTSDSVELAEGTYYLKEISAPSGYYVSDEVFTVELKDGDDKSITVADPPIPAVIELVKASANPDLTDGNINYTLEDAVYGIYSNSSCTDLIERLTTDENGKATSGELALGTYYVKEIDASQGYDVDETVYTVEAKLGSTDLSKGSEPLRVTVNSKEVPESDPVTVLLEKVDSDGTVPSKLSLEGAQFEVKFYDERMDTDPGAVGYEPLRTWVFESKKEGAGYGVRYLNSYKVSGSDLYTDEQGSPSLPYGTVTIQEKKAPEGYKVNDTIYVVKVGENFQVGPVYHEVEIANEALRIDIKKVEADSTNPLQGVTFRHTGPNNLSETVVTDQNGNVTFKNLTVGNHTIEEIATIDGYSLNIQKITFTVNSNGTIDITSKSVETELNGEIVVSVGSDGNIDATVENKPSIYKLHINKTNNKDFALQGAEFTLYSDAACKNVVSTGTTNSSGDLTFEDLIIGDTYYLKETKAPTGYRIPVNDDGSDIVYTIKAESSPSSGVFNFIVNDTTYTSSSTGNYWVSGSTGDRVCNMTIINEVGLKLPNTGSNMMILLVIAGVALVAGSIICRTPYNKKRTEE